jgi:uncharacterized membrane protein
MTASLASRLFSLVLAAVVVIYPVLVYFFIDRFSVAALALALGVLLLLRVLPLVRQRPLLVALAIGGVGVFLLGIFWSGNARLLLLYPTLVSLVMLAVFSLTLWYPPSMIERFSRMLNMEIPPPAIPYMKVVTMVWCGFFAANALVSAWLAWLGSMAWWTIYNGFISYLVIGVLIVGEFLYRGIYKRRHGLA